MRCKVGDIVVVQNPGNGCPENLGRFGEVTGPVYVRGEWGWWVQPKTTFVGYDHPDYTTKVERPLEATFKDEWLLPIPKDGLVEDLSTEREKETV